MDFSTKAVILLALFCLTIIVTLFIFANTSEKVKRMNFVMESEVPLFRKLGLESFISSSGYNKEITFYHPKIRFSVPYNFNKQAANKLTDGVPLEELLNAQDGKIKYSLKRVEQKVLKFMKSNDLNYSLQHIAPLVFIFGLNAEEVRKAAESQIHPALIAAILERSKDMNGLKYPDEVLELPIEWLSKIYNFEYRELQLMGR